MSKKKVVHKPKHKWDADTRKLVITDYAHTGNMAQTHRNYPEVPVDTVRSMVESESGVALIAELHSLKATEHRQAYSRLVDASLAKAEQGIAALGDELSAGDIRALIVSGAVGTDKLRLADSLPSTITSTGIADLQKQFEAMAATHTMVPRSTIVDGSAVDNTNENDS